jgi:hypothetical protein
VRPWSADGHGNAIARPDSHPYGDGCSNGNVASLRHADAAAAHCHSYGDATTPDGDAATLDVDSDAYASSDCNSHAQTDPHTVLSDDYPCSAFRAIHHGAECLPGDRAGSLGDQ